MASHKKHQGQVKGDGGMPETVDEEERKTLYRRPIRAAESVNRHTHAKERRTFRI